jgi:sugar lactone lactonase YvrE
MPSSQYRVVSTARHVVGECPTWDDRTGTMLWTSIIEGRIYRLDPESGAIDHWQFEGPVGSFGLCRSRKLVVALRGSIVLFDPVSGRQEQLGEVSHRLEPMRLNDGKVGPDGAFYVGSLDDRPEKQPVGALYRVRPDGEVAVVADALTIANGLAWSPDGTVMYFSDSRGPWVDSFDFDPGTGATSGRRRFATLSTEAGRPDGAACDADGNYWSAGPSASCINRFSPAGDLLEKFAMPHFRPTMPCFGGSDFKTVYVTSLTQGLTPEQLAANPLAGTVIAFETEYAGTPTYRFAD